MIKPEDLIRQIDLRYDLNFFTAQDYGRGGFGFHLLIKGELGFSIKRKIEGRICWLTICGKFIVSGMVNPKKTLYVETVLGVEPTDEDVTDGYCYVCSYKKETNDYLYTKDAEKLVKAILDEMSIWWYAENDVDVEFSFQGGSMGLSTYRNLKFGDRRYGYK